MIRKLYAAAGVSEYWLVNPLRGQLSFDILRLSRGRYVATLRPAVSGIYKVTAEDAAGNISVASNEATATVADATPPTAPSSLAASVAGRYLSSL